jgi:hypothetical protein
VKRAAGTLLLLLIGCSAPPPPLRPLKPTTGATAGPGFAERFAELADGLALDQGSTARRRSEAQLAADLRLWPGVGAAAVHLNCPQRDPFAPPADCSAAVIVQSKPGAEPASLPDRATVIRLLLAGSPVASPERVELVLVPTSSPPGTASGATLASMGPFAVAPEAAWPLRVVFVALLGSLAGLALALRRARRRGAS